MSRIILHEERPARLGWCAIGCLLIAVAIGPETGLGVPSAAIVLLSGLGVVVFGATRPRQTVSVDPSRQALIIENATLWGRSERCIPRSDMGSIDCSFAGTGDTESVNGYQLHLKLVSGEIIPITRSYSRPPSGADRAAPPFSVEQSVRSALNWPRP
jgi:hypothetical protein